jgi:hypothetical protein
MARTAGVLEITETCVFLTNRDERTLLIWPSTKTLWDSARQSILFSDGGEVHRLSDGENVAFGGSGGGSGEGGEPPGLPDGIKWVAQPMPECVTPEYWFVGGLASN